MKNTKSTIISKIIVIIMFVLVNIWIGFFTPSKPRILATLKMDRKEGKNDFPIIKLPYKHTKRGSPEKIIKIVLDISCQEECTKFFKIKAGFIDEIFINFKKIDHINNQVYSDISRDGLIHDFSPYLNREYNTVEIFIKNKNLQEFDIKPYFNSFEILSFLRLVRLAVFFCFFYIFLTWMKFDKAEKTILIISNALFLLWCSMSPLNKFGMDYKGHLQYILFFERNMTIPDPSKGWIFYHPPLYYMITGAIKALTNIVVATHNYDVLRLFSLLCNFIFTIYSFKIFKIFIKDVFFYRLSIFMLAFWPIGIVIASRIDSNVLLMPIVVSSFYYLIKWYQDNKLENLKICLVITSFGILTRSNIVVLITVIFIISILKLLQSKVTFLNLLSNKMLRVYFLILICCSINFGRNLYNNYINDVNHSLIVSNSHYLPKRKVELKNFVSLDYSSLLQLNIPENKAKDSPNYWLFLLKSCVGGQFTLKANKVALLAYSCLMILSCYVFFPIFFYSREILLERLPLVLLLSVSIAASLCLTYLIPFMSSADFRYIYFSLIPIISLYLLHIKELLLGKYYLLGRVGIVLLFIFIISGIFIFTYELFLYRYIS